MNFFSTAFSFIFVTLCMQPSLNASYKKEYPDWYSGTTQTTQSITKDFNTPMYALSPNVRDGRAAMVRSAKEFARAYLNEIENLHHKKFIITTLNMDFLRKAISLAPNSDEAIIVKTSIETRLNSAKSDQEKKIFLDKWAQFEKHIFEYKNKQYNNFTQADFDNL